MENWTKVFKFEFLRQIRRRLFIATTILVPVVAIVVALFYATILSEDDDEISDIGTADEFDEGAQLGYVDETNNLPTLDDESFLNDFLIRYDTENDAKDALEANDIDGFYVIPSNYLESGDITLWVNDLSIGTLANEPIIESYLITALAGDTDPRLQVRLRAPIVNLDASGFDNFGVVYVFALIMMITLLTSSSYLMQSVVEEKENKSIELILTSVRPLALLVGKTLGMGLTGLVQISVWLTAMLVFATVSGDQLEEALNLTNFEVTPELFILGIVYFVLGFLFIGGVLAAIGAVVNTTREGSTLSSVVILPMLIPLFLLAIFTEDPNGPVPTLLSLIPFTAPLAMVMRFAVDSAPLIEVVISITLMIVLSAGSLWFASRMFHVGTLLSGEPFQPRRMLRYLLASD